MRIEIHHYHHADKKTRQKLDEVLGIVRDLQRKEVKEIMELKDLQTQVEKNTEVEGSAVTLIQGIASQLAAAKEDPAAIQALADKLNSSATALAAAITANTPAA